MGRFRTIRGVLEYIRDRDPATAITEHYLRKLVVSGALASRRSGTRYLVDLDDVDRFFENRTPNGRG